MRERLPFLVSIPPFNRMTALKFSTNALIIMTEYMNTVLSVYRRAYCISCLSSPSAVMSDIMRSVDLLQSDMELK